MSLLMESRLFIYIESSDGAWSLILMDIILTETELYLPWRVPHLTWNARKARKTITINDNDNVGIIDNEPGPFVDKRKYKKKSRVSIVFVS